ncbi:hypothetical protein SMACR_06899 [Sordaria macrospora]|uniref:WGS project CABT00000000 data, contig 2.38 n=2 Tax=Sordaria macrospora TaxID=5147 RepID=F7W7B0_SORMK|nr:uncharacterized protein SMAC_06899 [Sordaria macrospora k-hell]KAA8633634.1 hypothetical protein SMACR_06899 [Sordaria macrospora]WPJ59576.1 hypothetical protein SMAC4_06899 [Sordaria macrospora]CCC13401.1 unnamed protein product [Sordaria macrospora k-hell]
MWIWRHPRAVCASSDRPEEMLGVFDARECFFFPEGGLEVRQTRSVEDGGHEGIEMVDEENDGEREGEERPYLSKKIFIKAGPDDPFLRSPHPLEFEVEYTTKGKREGESKGEVTIHLPPGFTNETLNKVAGSTPPLYRKPHDMTDTEFRTFSLFRYMAMALPYPFPSSPSDATPHLHSGHSSHVCWGCLLSSRVTDYPADPELASHVGAWRELRMCTSHYRMLVYSREEYLQHFRWCSLAQERWEATIKNMDLRTGEEVVPEEYGTKPLENMDSGEWGVA